MEQMEKKPKKRPGKDFVSELSGKKTKRDYVGLGTPNKKKIKIKDDKSDFAGKNKAPKTIVKKNKVSKPKVVTPKMIKDAGFTTLRDYLNDKRGLTRKDGKKPVRVGDKKTVTNVVKPKLKPKNLVKKKSDGSKKVASLKTSRSGIDGGASQVNKAKVNKAKKKKSNFFDSIGSGIKKAVKETKRNFSGDFKKKTGRYKSISTGKTNFNKKK